MDRIGNYRLLERIGKGGSGFVVVGKHITQGTTVAIKIVPKNNGNIAKEVKFMKMVNHPFVVQFYEYLEDENNYYIVMEYVEGETLLDFIMHQEAPIEDWLIKHIFCELISCVRYLHNVLKLVHRDLKLENIMLDKNMNIRLIDFGLSNVSKEGSYYFKTVCGSPQYSAPEMIMGQEYSYAVDIWSLGVILYALSYRTFPFTDQNTKLLFSKIVETEPFYGIGPLNVVKSTIQECLQKDPKKRPTVEELFCNQWVKSYPNKAMFHPSFGISEGWFLNTENQSTEDLISSKIRISIDMSSLVKKSFMSTYVPSIKSKLANGRRKVGRSLQLPANVNCRRLFSRSSSTRDTQLPEDVSVLPALRIGGNI